MGKAEEVLPEFYEKESRKPDADMLHPDVIVVDPPRKGCDEKCLETMLRMKPERIVYVSCDPATLARDLKILCEGGYELRKVRPVDQFGHTTHVETVVLLSKGMFDSRKVKVDFSLEDMDLSEFKGKATYEQIKAYVLEQTGLKVFLRCILHRLRRNVDWMWERILICLSQRMRDSHNVHRRRKKRLCRRLSILELYRLWISCIVSLFYC